MRKLVIIPTYNEKENISAMIDKVFSLPEPFEILVIDDGSPDGTAAIVKERRKEFPERLHLMERAGKLGLGTAYLAGFRWGLENGFDYICEMDCDFSHNPDDLVRLYRAAAEGNDVVVGSRYVQGVNVVNWPMSRLLMSYFASMYVRIVTRMPLRDATAGFVCYSRRALETIDLDAVRMKGYGFQIEMKYSAWRLGMRLKEVSIIFADSRDAQEPKVLARDVGIFVLERPDAVENVVRSRGAEEPQRIGHIFVQLQPLLAEIGDAEIDEDARAADDAEFEKLFYHKFPTSVGTDFPLNQFV